jgi:hypothetical protein
MDLSTGSDEQASILNIRRGETELRRLVQTKRDLEVRLSSARDALVQANSARQVLLMDRATMRIESAVEVAEDRVRRAGGLIRELEEGLASAHRDCEAAQARLDAAHDQARRLDEAASIALVLCEIVDALKEFERASQRFASALDGSRERGKHDAPLIAASVRINEIRFASEARAVIREIEGYRAGLIDGSVKLKTSVSFEPGHGGSEPARPHEFLGSGEAISIAPASSPSPILSTGRVP